MGVFGISGEFRNQTCFYSSMTLCYLYKIFQTHQEGVWCHKSKSLGLRKYQSLVHVSVGLRNCQCWLNISPYLWLLRTHPVFFFFLTLLRSLSFAPLSCEAVALCFRLCVKHSHVYRLLRFHQVPSHSACICKCWRSDIHVIICM